MNAQTPAIRKAASEFASLLVGEYEKALARLQAAEAEAMGRIKAIAPEAASELDLKEAAAFLRIGTRTLQRRVQNREIAYRRDGGRLLFARSALEAYRKTGAIRVLELPPL